MDKEIQRVCRARALGTMLSLWSPLRGLGVRGSTGCPHPFLARPEPTVAQAPCGNGGTPAQQGRREEGSGREGRGGEGRTAPLSATSPCGGCTASRQAAGRRRTGRRGLWRGGDSGDHARPQRGWLPPHGTAWRGHCTSQGLRSRSPRGPQGAHAPRGAGTLLPASLPQRAPRRPGPAGILPAPVRLWRPQRDPLVPPRRLVGQHAPLRWPGRAPAQKRDP